MDLAPLAHKCEGFGILAGELARGRWGLEGIDFFPLLSVSTVSSPFRFWDIIAADTHRGLYYVCQGYCIGRFGLGKYQSNFASQKTSYDQMNKTPCLTIEDPDPNALHASHNRCNADAPNTPQMRSS